MLDLKEVVEGVAAYFDPVALKSDPRVSKPSGALTLVDSRIGPFVCVRVHDGRSQWTPLTTKFRRERLMIRMAWRSGGDGVWRKDRMYLGDGANVWTGPHEAFILASAVEIPFDGPVRRPRIRPDGIRSIRKEIETQLAAGRK